MTNKSTPITMEMFDEAILPRIEEIFEDKIQKFSDKLEDKIQKYREEVVEFKTEVVGEIKSLREEVTVTKHHYERTNERVDKIDKHLGIDTSVVF